MAATYNWNISSLDCYPENAGQTDVVFKIYYYVEAISDETHEVFNADGSSHLIPYKASVSGVTETTYKQGDPFTPYNDLTQDQVLLWIKDDLTPAGVSNLISELDKKLAAEISPSIVSPPLPWSS